MSEWHYSMQNRFPEEQREIIVKYKGQTHRADILYKNKIIEFQHSPISIDELEERNNFYNAAGYCMAWVFDVQEQYNSEAITIMDHDLAIMYKWSNPKRCLQCFPKPNEYNKKLVIHLYWMGEDGCECFNRVICSKSDYECPNFKKFIISEYSMGLDETDSFLSVEDFFDNKGDLLKNRLSELNYRYKIKYSGFNGHQRDAYVCPKTNIFGFKIFSENGSKNCRYSAVIRKFRDDGYKLYCCYPNQVNEVKEEHPGYECSNVSLF